MTAEPEPKVARGNRLHPVLIMLAMMLVTMVLTHVVPAGRFDRADGKVVAGSFKRIPQIVGLPALLAPSVPKEKDTTARAAGFVAVVASIPAGVAKSVNLVFMVMFVGGMFGVLKATGAIDSGVDRLLYLSSGNVALLTTGLMFVLACGATFLGFLSEYLVLVPLVCDLGRRLGMPRLYAPVVVGGAGMIGYAASVTNPIALATAQPLAGVPVFSGLAPRAAIFAIMFGVGLAYVLFWLRRFPGTRYRAEPHRLSMRHVAVLISVLLGGIALVIGTAIFGWESPELGAVFIAIGMLLALVGGLPPAAAADAFLEGMKGMLLAGLIIGLAGATTIILTSSQVLDTVVQALANALQGHQSGVVAIGLMGAEMVFDVLINSVSGKAAISMPILSPIAQLSGVSGQVTVTALLMGSGLTNMITPTNPLLLAFLASSDVSYVEWARFMAPLVVVLILIGFAALYVMSLSGL